MKVLVTGAAGFIGFHLANVLLERGDEVVGVDNLCQSYDPKLKTDRLKLLKGKPGFESYELDILDITNLNKLFKKHKFEKVFHLAALGGVSGSTKNPELYLSTNINGFVNILEGCRKSGISHLIYASSSSVYGANSVLPNSTHQAVDHPLSVYAVTKRADELLAHSFSHIYKLPTTGLRFFTVYGPWGRPDMAIFRFTKAILQGETLELFGDGKMRRDFTYIDDAIDGILKAASTLPTSDPSAAPGPAASADPFRIYNIGFGEPISVLECVKALEEILGKTAKTLQLPARTEDVMETHSDTSELKNEFGFQPKVPIREGLRRFAEWYRGYYFP